MAARMARWCLLFCWGVGPLSSAAIPGLEQLSSTEVLSPGSPIQVRVGIGEAKYMRFSCRGGPADAVVTLSTYAEQADPLLLLSLRADRLPSFSGNDASTFKQWLEDDAGDHYVMANGLSPQGGTLGLLNIRKFAAQELIGVLTIRCSYIIAFDTIFWDHLRSNAICPVGSQLRTSQRGAIVTEAPDNFCSGHGVCERHGLCKCDNDHTGSACEHEKYDVVVGQDFKFEVKSGKYQYFRVHIPPRFEGGYVEVKIRSSEPLVVLLRSDDLPTKNKYELSNFNDWVSHRNQTDLRLKVTSSDGITAVSTDAGPYGAAPNPSEQGGRRLTDFLEKEATGWFDFFRNAADVQAGLPARPRQLLSGVMAGGLDECPKMSPDYKHPSCKTSSMLRCKDSCLKCILCVKGSKDDMACSASCQACIMPDATVPLQIVQAISVALAPKRRSARLGVGDDGCLPLAAKCLSSHASESRYVFVGVFNHRRYFNDAESITATADISLTADPSFVRRYVPTDATQSWTAELYDSFHDVQSIELASREEYPSGEQFMHELDLKNHDTERLEARVYRDRLTLLQVRNTDRAEHLELQFLAGPEISHVLTSSAAAPKTLFDFDAAYEQTGDTIVILAGGQESIWCAIFGKSDGFAQITARAYGTSPVRAGSPANFSFALVCVLFLLCGLAMLGAISGGFQKLSDTSGTGGGSLPGRLMEMVRNRGRRHESTVSLTRGGSLQGYTGSDVIDRTVEDQYLHRGGLGDEGL
eukprot:CAMPEP_0115159742 /NCGR_PEP_ID=MMETSP0227-20121206/70414_1 /TAXON_ID=89957 /ORGANISM="Polarella glacialis, Strain CCMP 1383" /LENGTH=752 /DNA_ID=CAMNT_0002571553 /DNA_START=93 /DNA_END=2353 /DNA_ORIENTATION=+